MLKTGNMEYRMDFGFRWKIQLVSNRSDALKDLERSKKSWREFQVLAHSYGLLSVWL